MIKLMWASKGLGAALAALLLLFVGLAVCPSPPSARRVDPDVLLGSVREAEAKASYSASAEVQSPAGKPSFSGSILLLRKGPEIYITPRGRTASSHLDRLITPNIPHAAAGITPLVEGEDIIAGRQCWILRLKPDAKRAPWTQLWVDKNTNVVLAFREWSSKGELSRSIKFVSVRFVH